MLIKQLDRNRREAEKAEKEKEKAEAKEKEKESMQCDIKTETTAIVSALLIPIYTVYSFSYLLLGDWCCFHWL